MTIGTATETPRCARLQGRVVILAGGAGGIGTATAQRLASEGAAVVVADIDLNAAREVAEGLCAEGHRAIATRVDIGDDRSVREMVELGIQTFGRLDGIHANAADLSILDRDTDALNIDLEVWDHTLRVNLRGYVSCTRHALPHLLASGGGAIVYTSSVASFFGEPTRVAYAASKAGVNALTRHVASAWGKQNIRANAIAPGTVATRPVLALPQAFRDEMLAQCRTTRLGEPGDIAGMVAYLMSDDGAWVQGQVFSVDGGTLMR